MNATPRTGSAHLRALALVLVGIVSVQVGAAFAKGIFDLVDPTGLVWLRLAFSSAVMVLLARPVLTGRSRTDWAVALGFGMSLAVMNWSIYHSFARIPIGIAVTIEFLGPLAVALLGSRRLRDYAWVLLAGAGVALLGAERTALDWVGVAYALLAGAAWAAYILLSAATGRRWPGLDGLSVASVVAAVGLALPALAVAGGDLLEPKVLVVGALVALMSSVVPYSCELVALRTIPTATLGILMSLEPAAAAVAALLLLGEELSAVQWVAVGCVVVASVQASRAATPRRRREDLDSPAPL